MRNKNPIDSILISSNLARLKKERKALSSL